MRSKIGYFDCFRVAGADPSMLDRINISAISMLGSTHVYALPFGEAKTRGLVEELTVEEELSETGVVVFYHHDCWSRLTAVKLKAIREAISVLYRRSDRDEL